MRKIITICTILIVFNLYIQQASAETEGRVDFSIKAILPDNQADASKTYFSLNVEPGETQRLGVNVYNHSNKMRTFSGKITYATTNRNGIIEYNESRPEKKDASLAYGLSEIAELEKNTLTIPPGEKGVFYINVEVPMNINGTILGGIRVKEDTDQDQKEVQGIKILNDYAYVIGIEMKHKSEQVKPNLSLKKIKPSLTNYRTSVQVDIQNQKAMLMDNLILDAKIYHKGENKVFRTEKKSGVRMAPNSTIQFPIDWNGEKIKPGEYRLVMTAKGDQGEWRWNESFTIGEEVKKINEESIVEDSNLLYYVLLFLVVALCSIGIVIYVRKKRKEHKHENKRAAI